METLDNILCAIEDFFYNITHPFSHQVILTLRDGETLEEMNIRYRQDYLGENRPITVK